MGKVVPFPERCTFPGAHVDYDHLDNFEWSPVLLHDYAERARAAAARYGSSTPRGRLPTWPPGRCQDCRRTNLPRCRIGRQLLCERCAEPRLRVHDEITGPARGGLTGISNRLPPPHPSRMPGTRGGGREEEQ